MWRRRRNADERAVSERFRFSSNRSTALHRRERAACRGDVPIFGRRRGSVCRRFERRVPRMRLSCSPMFSNSCGTMTDHSSLTFRCPLLRGAWWLCSAKRSAPAGYAVAWPLLRRLAHGLPCRSARRGSGASLGRISRTRPACRTAISVARETSASAILSRR